MRLFRHYLLPGIWILSAGLWIADQVFNFRDLLRLNVPPWFWSVTFATVFFVSIIGAVVTWGREVERLREGTSAPPVQPRPQTRVITLADRMEARVKIGRNIVEGLERTQGYSVSRELQDAIWKWGHESADLLDLKYSGDAAFFRSELPRSGYADGGNVRGRCLAYMNQRLKDLERLIARETTGSTATSERN